MSYNKLERIASVIFGTCGIIAISGIVYSLIR